MISSFQFQRVEDSMGGYGNFPDLSAVKKILVIKLRHLGDVLLTSPVFTALKTHLPHAEVDAYVYQESIPMLSGHPAISSFIGYDRSWKKRGLLLRLAKETSLLREIRRQNYDLVLNLTEGDRGVIAALMSKAQVKAGFRPKGKWQRKSLTHIAKDCHSPRHTVEKNLDLLRRIGIFLPPEERGLFFHIPEEDRKAAKALVKDEPFILIHPVSRWRFKCWPVQKMRELIQRLLKDGMRVAVSAGPDPGEMRMAEKICRGFPILNLAGAVSLKQLGALIELSEVLLCVDSVPFHMASALRKNVVALFGPTSETAWGPWQNPNATVLTMPLPCRPCHLDGCGGSKRSDCLETLPVEKVYHALLAHFKKPENHFIK